MTLSSYHFLRNLFPESTLSFAFPQWMCPLFQSGQNIFWKLLPIKGKGLFSILKFLWACSKNSYDLIIDLNESGRFSQWVKYYCILKRLPYFVHNHRLLDQNLLNSSLWIYNQGQIAPNIQRDLDALFSYFVKIKNYPLIHPHFITTPAIYPGFEVNTPPTKKSLRCVLGIVGTRSTKMWPIENFIDLIIKLKTVFSQISFLIPLSKSPLDQHLKKEWKRLMALHLKEISNNNDVEFLEASLSELPAIFSKAHLYIGNDTGLKHLACSFNLATLTFFGPEDPYEWHPYDQQQHRVLYLEGMTCRTRTSHYCGLIECDQEPENKLACLKKITVNQALQTIIEMELMNRSYKR